MLTHSGLNNVNHSGFAFVAYTFLIPAKSGNLKNVKPACSGSTPLYSDFRTEIPNKNINYVMTIAMNSAFFNLSPADTADLINVSEGLMSDSLNNAFPHFIGSIIK